MHASSPAVALARSLFTNNVLVHVNLSHNRFSEKECAILAEAVKVCVLVASFVCGPCLQYVCVTWIVCVCVLCVFGPRQFNHSILGIHMHGNAARVDVAGFVIPLAHHHHHDGDDHHELPSPLPSRPSSPPHTTTSGRIADRPTTTIAGARAATARPAPGTPGTPGAAPTRPMTAAAVQAARLQAAASNSGVGEGTSVAMARSHKHNTAAHLNQSTLYGRRKHRIGAGEDKALGIAMFRCVLRACLSMCRVGAAPLTLCCAYLLANAVTRGSMAKSIAGSANRGRKCASRSPSQNPCWSCTRRWLHRNGGPCRHPLHHAPRPIPRIATWCGCMRALTTGRLVTWH